MKCLNDSPLVSIVVPVYNVEPYVERCIESIASQKYPNIECIIVDDVGKDRSIEIVNSYVARYGGHVKFKIITHSYNKGLSVARNSGLDIAKGKYIWFVDSDDYIVQDAVSRLVSCAQKSKSDIIYFDVWDFYTGGKDRIAVNTGNESSNPGSLELLFEKKRWAVQFRFYSLPFLRRYSLRFLEGAVFEDQEFNFRAYYFANQHIFYLKDRLYNYLHRGNGSIMSSKWSRKKTESVFSVSQSLFEFFSEDHKKGKHQVVIEKLISYNLRNLFFSCGYYKQYEEFLFSLNALRRFSLAKSQNLTQRYAKAFVSFIYGIVRGRGSKIYYSLKRITKSN